MDIEGLSPNEILKLLETCDELDFNELIGDLQNHLIKKEEKWIQQNLIYIYEISLKHHSFDLLQEYCNENLNLLLKSDGMSTTKKSTFISILKRDDLGLKEIDIWDYVIRWGIGQNEEKMNKDVSEWDDDDFIKLKNTLNGIIPLVRFNQISSDDFFKKIKPYKKMFNEMVYKEILFMN